MRSSAPRRAGVFRNVLGRTLWISAMVTLICLRARLSGRVSSSPRSRRAAPSLLLFLVLLPFWTSLLVRTAAWVVLLQERWRPQ